MTLCFILRKKTLIDRNYSDYLVHLSNEKESQHIEIEIDKLTNSIENVFTGDSCPTEVILLEKGDIKHVTEANAWLFNWKKNINIQIEIFIN